MNIKVGDVIDDIEVVEGSEPYVISEDLITNKNNRQFKLLGNESLDFKYKLNNKCYVYNLNEDIFLKRIIVESEKGNLNGLEIILTNSHSDKVVKTITVKGQNSVPVDVNAIVNQVAFRAPPRTVLNKIKLSSIKFIGYTQKDFKELEEKFIILDSLKETLLEIGNNNQIKSDELDRKNTNLDNEIVDKSAQINNLESAIRDLVSNKENSVGEVADLNNTISSLSTEEKNLSASNTSLEDNIGQLQHKRDEVNKNISESKTELSRLERDKNIFAYEVQEYISQGNKNIKLYLLVSLIPWVLIAYITYLAFNGTADLTTLLNEKPEIDIWMVLGSRIPFVILAGTIVVASYGISKVFINRIIDIHQQKLSFTKLGIIAKDVSDTSADGLEFNDDELFEVRTKLKMDLLKSHLSKDVGKVYSYEINTSLWDLFRNRLKNKKVNEANSAETEEG